MTDIAFSKLRKLQTPVFSTMGQSQLNYTPVRFLKNWNDRRGKAKRWKMKKLPHIPTFMQTIKPDPFDYELQTKEQVQRQLAINDS